MITRDNARSIIKIPDLSQHSHLSNEEREQLKEVLFNIKYFQLLELKTDLIAALEMIFSDDLPLEASKRLLDLATLQGLTKLDQLRAVADIAEGVQDPELRAAMSKEQLSDEDSNSLYTVVYNLRHKYFLDKAFKVKDNELAFPERVSQCKQHRGHSNISKYLNGGCSDLNAAEKQLLAKAFPKDEEKMKAFGAKAHLAMKTFKREVQEFTINLTLEEIQILFFAVSDYTLAARKQPLTLTPLKDLNKWRYDIYTLSPGMTFIANNELENFKAYLNQNALDINIFDSYLGVSFLSYAIKQQKKDIIYWLLQQKTKLIADRNYYTPLHYAAEGNDSKILAVISKAQGQIDFRDAGGYTALYVAAELGKDTNLRLLLEAGANPNVNANRYGNTPLHTAVRHNQAGCVRILLQHPKTDPKLLDKGDRQKQPDTAYGLAVKLNNPDIIKIFKELNKCYLPAAPSQMPAAAAKPAAQQTVTPTLSHWDNIKQMGTLLSNAKIHKDHLLRLAKTPHHIMPSASPLDGKEDMSFTVRMKAEQQAEDEYELKFQHLIGTRLKSFTGKRTFTQDYRIIYQLTNTVINEGLSLRRFAEELVRYNFIQHLIELEDSKTVLQVAIDDEDVEEIKIELKETPDHENIKVLYKNQRITELQYAIMTGKPNSVEALVNAATQNPNVKLGIIPPNAKEQAEQNLNALLVANPAYREADDHFNINIPQASLANTLRVLRELMKTVPSPKQSVVNYLFAPQEYDLLKLLLNDKHNEKPKPLRLQILRTLRGIWILIKRFTQINAALEQHMMSMQNLEQASQDNLVSISDLKAKIADESHELVSIKKAIKYQLNQLRGGIKSRQEKLIAPDGPRMKNIYRHATQYVRAIEKAGKLVTVQEVLNQGVMRQVSTPLGSRNNIFFSPPGSELTPLRSKAGGVIEIDMAAAIAKGLIKEDEFYTSPHLSAFAIERVEPAIVFIGEDGKEKTIYRIYHTKKQKIYIFEYYKDDQLVGSKEIKLNISDEMFLGNNIRMFALRMLLWLRYIKGPLQNSYSDYFYKNFNQENVIRALQAAIFDVLSVEGKVTKAIDVKDQDAVKISRNGELFDVQELNQHTVITLTAHIKSCNLPAFQQMVESLQIKNEQLKFALIAAIKSQSLPILEWLLKRGVRPHFNNNEPLREAINQLETEYLRAKGNEADHKVGICIEMIALLVNSGASSAKDPLHIRYLSTGDNFALLAPNAWTYSTQLDLHEITKFIFRFKQLSIQKLLLATVHKHLDRLYDITANHGFFELHKYIADRLNKPSFFELKNEALATINQEDIEKLKNLATFLKKLSLSDLENSFYQLTYAILNEKCKAVEVLYPVFQACGYNQHINSSLSLAIQHKKEKIARIIVGFGSDVHSLNILGVSPIQLDLENDLGVTFEAYLASLSKDPVKRESSLYSAINTSIETGRNNFLAQLLQQLNADIRYNNPSLIPSSLTFAFDMFTQTAIDNMNLDAFVMLREKIGPEPDDGEAPEFYSTCIYHAAKNNKTQFLKELLAQIKKNQQLAKAIFKDISKIFDFLRNTSEKANEETMAALLNGIHQMFPSKNNPMMKTNETKSKNPKQQRKKNNTNLLHVAIECRRKDAVILIRKILPELPYITEKYDALKFYKNFTQTTDDPSWLEFLYQNGLCKPSKEEWPALLALLLLMQKYKIVHWLFENKILDEKYTSTDGKNLLQLASLKYKNEPVLFSLSTTIALESDFIEYLFSPGMFDPHHKDNDGKTLLEYLPTYSFVRDLKEYIITYTNLDFTILEGKGNFLIRRYWPEATFAMALDKYLAAGGHINEKNSDDYTCLEEHLIAGTTKEIITKLKEKGAIARKVLMKKNLSFSLTISKEDNQWYYEKDRSTSSCFTHGDPRDILAGHLVTETANGHMVDITIKVCAILHKHNRSWEPLTQNLHSTQDVAEEINILKFLHEYIQSNQQLQREEDSFRLQLTVERKQQLKNCMQPLIDLCQQAGINTENKTLTKDQTYILKLIDSHALGVHFMLWQEEDIRYEVTSIPALAVHFKNDTLMDQALAKNSAHLIEAMRIAIGNQDHHFFDKIMNIWDEAEENIEKHFHKLIAEIYVFESMKFLINKIRNWKQLHSKLSHSINYHIKHFGFTSEQKEEFKKILTEKPKRQRNTASTKKSKKPKSEMKNQAQYDYDSSADEKESSPDDMKTSDLLDISTESSNPPPDKSGTIIRIKVPKRKQQAQEEPTAESEPKIKKPANSVGAANNPYGFFSSAAAAAASSSSSSNQFGDDYTIKR